PHSFPTRRSSDLLFPAVAELERPPGRAVRPARAAVPRLRTDLLAAGLLLPRAAADHRRAVAVLLHRAGRTPVVRLRLPADGVDGSVRVDGRSEEHTSELQS